MTKIELAKQALQSLYLEVDSRIADDVKSKVLSALEEAREDERNQGRGDGPVCKTREWQLCPKCNGQGIVSKPSYVAGDVYQWTGTGISFPCDVCNGAKIIEKPIAWLKEPDKLEQSKKEQ